MAKSQQNYNMFSGFGLMCLVLMVHKTYAREFMVGGSKGWSVPSDPQGYNQWAERNRFQIGDSLVFNYQANQDSVVQVTSDAYAKCTTDKAIAKFTDGHSSIKLSQSGPHYFISGNKDNCHKNEKLLIIVMADRNSNSSASPPSPTPSPSPSPTSASSPPVTGTFENPPAPSPSAEGPPNAASSSFSSFSFFLTISFCVGVAMASSSPLLGF